MNTYAEKKKSPMLTKKQQSPQKSSDEMLRSGLSSLHSRPAALSEELGNKIRERCGINPASVKVYRDDGLSGLGQKAYAKGAEIHLSGGVSTSGEEGQRVVLHEAAHIAQQGSRSVAGAVNDDPALEQQADRVAAGEVMQGSFSVPVNSENAPVQGWAPWDKAKKKFAEKKERDAKRTAAFAEGTSLGNKHLDRLVAANDWVRDKMDDFRDFRSGVKEKIADKYHGSKFESGVNKTKGWFKGVGSGIAGMAKSAGNWVKDKATDAGTAIKGSKLGQWVSRKKEERAKKKAEEALKPKEPGKFSKFMTGAKNWVSDKAKSAGGWISDKAKAAGSAIKGSKLGQWVSRKKEERAKKKAAEAQKEPGWFKKTAAAAGEKIKSGAGWVKDKAVKGGTWVKNKAVKAGKWISKKKDDISDWIEEKKQAYADHDDQRYLKRLVRKGGASALNAIAMADQDLKHGEYSGNVKHRAEALRDYDEEKRQFMTDEESKAAKAAKKAEPLSAGKVLDVVGDNVDVVGSVMSAHDARKRGNSQQAALDSMDAINSGMGYVTKGLSSLDLPGLSAVGDVAEMGTTIGKLGIHSYQKHKLNGVDEAGQTAGVDEADQKYMRIAHSGYGNTLDQEIRSGVGDVAKYGISALGSGLSAVTGGVSSTVAKGLNKAVDLGVSHMNSSAREKTDSEIGYEDIFGSVDAAKKFKSKHSIDKNTMEILMRRNTGSRSMSDLADRSRYEAARVNHQYLAREGDNGAKKMMAAFGEKNFEQTPLSMIDEKIGQSHSLKELNKRRRLAY
ncbi:MAG TPA: hypothetical protein DHW32_03490 [Ruminococcaceae bacterium]|nr:hypothetical protein [Oscillospiraceae bacterium]HCK49777.1 hypothetical protein [Oscillospiraceae bacterium]